MMLFGARVDGASACGNMRTYRRPTMATGLKEALPKGATGTRCTKSHLTPAAVTAWATVR